MRKIALYIILATLAIPVANARKFSDKTFLMPRTQLTNLPMEYSFWYKDLNRKPNAKYNGTIQAVGFYQESQNKADIGKYFGFDWKNYNNSGLNIVNQIGLSTNNITDKLLKNSYYIIHNYNYNAGGVANTITGNFKFEPYQTVYGVKVSYNQDLDKILDGLYFRVNAPIVNVKNNMNCTVLTPLTKQKLPDGIGLTGQAVDLFDYLSGKVENNIAANLQQPLKYAKIDNASHSKSGIADINFMLGYNFWFRKHSRFGINTSLTVPTGNDAKGEYIFEPIYGNANHWALGAGFDAGAFLWKRDNKSIELQIVGNYNYLFESTEKRTLNYTQSLETNRTIIMAGYYNLAGQTGQKGVFPAANILTQDLRVTPRSQLDGIIALAFNWGNATFNIGYNFFLKDAESVNLKNRWENDTYAISDVNYNANNLFDTIVHAAAGTQTAWAYTGAADGTNAAIQNTNLDFSSATNPSVTTHKIYGGLGYEWTKISYPVLLGLGASYEYTQRNSALEGWALWLKAAISW